MRRCISEPTIRFPRPAPRSVATSAFTTPGALIRALTGRRQTMLTSLACRTSRQPEPGRRSTYQNRNAVQTNRATAGNGTPMAVWREGVARVLGRADVDMTLRLDNARALPTYPQPPQQQQAA